MIKSDVVESEFKRRSTIWAEKFNKNQEYLDFENYRKKLRNIGLKSGDVLDFLFNNKKINIPEFSGVENRIEDPITYLISIKKEYGKSISYIHNINNNNVKGPFSIQSTSFLFLSKGYLPEGEVKFTHDNIRAIFRINRYEINNDKTMYNILRTMNLFPWNINERGEKIFRMNKKWRERLSSWEKELTIHTPDPNYEDTMTCFPYVKNSLDNVIKINSLK